MKKKLCFVIMPFARKFAAYYQAIYVPAIEAAGLDSKKADTDRGPELLLDSICRNIISADVLLAELTGKKLNVSYEVGYAHAKGKPVILIAQSMRVVPSDIQHIRVVLYDERKRGWRKNLKEKITEAIKEVTSNPNRYRPREISAVASRAKITRRRPEGSQPVAPRSAGGGATKEQKALTRAVQVVARQIELGTIPAQQSGTHAFLRVKRAVPSQVKQLAALLKDYFKVDLQWKGEGDEYALWWDAGGGPDVSKVAEFAEMLGMAIRVEGLSA